MRTAAAVAAASATGMSERAPVLEEQELDGEEHGRHGAAEGGGHARGGARGEQRLALVGGRRSDLADERAERAAGGDDRPLGAERTAGADRDRRRERLQEREPRAGSGSR